MKKGLTLLLALLLLLLSGCGEKEAEAPALLEPVGAHQETVTVSRGDIYEVTGYNYSVAPMLTEVVIEATGRVDSCLPIGTKVQAGDVLLTLDVKSAEKELQKLKEQKKDQETENEYTLALMQMDIDLCKYEMEHRDYALGSKQEEEKQNELASLLSALEQEKAKQGLSMSAIGTQIKEYEKTLEQSCVYAPVSGTVALSELGESFHAGDLVCIIAQDDKPVIRGEYLTPTLLENASEVRAIIGGKSYPVTPVPQDESEVISNRTLGMSVTSDFTVDGEFPSDVSLGDYVYLTVLTDLQKDVLWIPPNALYRDAQQYFVYKKTESGKEKVPVTVGKKLSTAIEIREGLKEGDELYVP